MHTCCPKLFFSFSICQFLSSLCSVLYRLRTHPQILLQSEQLMLCCRVILYHHSSKRVHVDCCLLQNWQKNSLSLDISKHRQSLEYPALLEPQWGRIVQTNTPYHTIDKSYRPLANASWPRRCPRRMKQCHEFYLFWKRIEVFWMGLERNSINCVRWYQTKTEGSIVSCEIVPIVNVKPIRNRISPRASRAASKKKMTPRKRKRIPCI